MFLNLRHNSEHVDAVISGRGLPQENRVFRFSHIQTKIAFHPNRKFFSQTFIAWNIGSDKKKNGLCAKQLALAVPSILAFKSCYFCTLINSRN